MRSETSANRAYNRVRASPAAYLQIFTCSALSAACALPFEETDPRSLLAGWGPLLYTGFLSCAVACLFQTLGRKYVNPVGVSLLPGLESVFAAGAGLLSLHEILNGKEILGCTLIFAATMLARLPGRKTVGPVGRMARQFRSNSAAKDLKKLSE